MSKVHHDSQTPPSVDPLLVTPTKQRIVKRKTGWGNVKKYGAKDGKKREASSKRNHDCCKCGKVWSNPENNTCWACWQEKKPDTPPKKKRKAQTLTEQTLNDEEKAILDKLRDPKTIGRYELVYKPTQKRTIDQCYNKVAEMESIVQEQRVKEVRLLNEMHQAQLTSQSSLATKKRNGKS